MKISNIYSLCMKLSNMIIDYSICMQFNDISHDIIGCMVIYMFLKYLIKTYTGLIISNNPNKYICKNKYYSIISILEDYIINNEILNDESKDKLCLVINEYK